MASPVARSISVADGRFGPAFRRNTLLCLILAFVLGGAQTASARACTDPDQGRQSPPDPTDAGSQIRLNVYVSPAPTPAEATTALLLATFAARKDHRANPVIQVCGLDRTAPLPGVDLEPFSVGGDATGAPEAAIDPREGERPAALPFDRRTLKDLGYPRLEMHGVGAMTQKILFSQADLGGPVSDVVFHLAGTQVGLAPNARAELSVLLNGGLVHSTTLHPSDRVEISTRLPRALLRRDNTLTLRVVHTPSREARPGGDGAWVAQFDPASHLALTHGQTLAPGFERFPQALLPSFHVSFDRLTPESLQSAAQVVAVLQQLTRVPLSPMVVEWSEALAADKPLIAVALDPRSARALKPPLAAGAFRLLDSSGNEVLRFGSDSRFAVMQAFTARGRDVLLLTHSNWPEGVIPLARGLAAGHGWYGLSGDLSITANDRLPFSLRLRGSGLVVESIPAPRWTWWESTRRPIFLGVAVLMGAFLLWSRPRLVRAQPGA